MQDQRRVEERRDGRRSKGVAVAGGFRPHAGASISTVTPFPLPAHRTGRALLTHHMWLTTYDALCGHASYVATLTQVAENTTIPSVL